jgi:DNA polymerase-3 subunit beta
MTGIVDLAIGKRAHARAGGVEIVSRMVDATYPNISQVIPKPGAVAIHVDAAELRERIRSVSRFASAKAGAVVLTAEEGHELRIAACDAERGECEDVIPCEVEGDGPVKVRYNWHYVIDALTAIDAPRVRLDVRDSLSPTLITAEGSDALHVVMPLRG